MEGRLIISLSKDRERVFVELEYENNAIILADIDFYHGPFRYYKKRLKSDYDIYAFSVSFLLPIKRSRRKTNSIVKRHADIAPSREVDIVSLSVDLLELLQ